MSVSALEYFSLSDVTITICGDIEVIKLLGELIKLLKDVGYQYNYKVEE